MLHEETEAFIKDVVKKVIKMHNVKYPINMNKLIRNIGGSNKKDDMMLRIKKTDKGFIIFSDGSNFQKALMLGYLYLFLGFETSTWDKLENKDYFYNSDKQFEIIRYFTYDLLMPDDLFLKELYKTFDDNKKAKAEDIAKIGKKFKVSPTLIFSKAKKYIY